MKKTFVLLLVALLVVTSVVVTATIVAPLTGLAAGARPDVTQTAVTQTGVQPAARPAGSTSTTTFTSAASSVTAAPAITTTQQSVDDESQLLKAVYQKVNPSVVQIINLAQANGFRSQNLGVVPQSEGSGFVWDMQGDIVTNDHVVQGADKLQVVFADGTQADATLVGADASSDLAVVRVDPTLTTLVPVDRGDMSQVAVGEMAIAIGNPFGFTGTMTRGIVSALGRTIPSQSNFNIPEAIQTDAAINPGNSGGPLLNNQGQVIGVNDQIQSASGSNSGVGFAIPVSIVERVVPSIIKTGQYQHPYLGISGSTYSTAWAQALGFPKTAKGAYIAEVVAGSPAAQAGLKAGTQDTSVLLGVDQTGPVYLQSGGDLITAIDGNTITKMDDLLIYLVERTSPGQTVNLTVLRANGQKATMPVTLGVQPTSAAPTSSNQ
jgi:S1-C subfamily serine protease